MGKFFLVKLILRTSIASSRCVSNQGKANEASTSELDVNNDPALSPLATDMPLLEEIATSSTVTTAMSAAWRKELAGRVWVAYQVHSRINVN
jgi:hypothetical protein